MVTRPFRPCCLADEDVAPDRPHSLLQSLQQFSSVRVIVGQRTKTCPIELNFIRKWNQVDANIEIYSNTLLNNSQRCHSLYSLTRRHQSPRNPQKPCACAYARTGRCQASHCQPIVQLRARHCSQWQQVDHPELQTGLAPRFTPTLPSPSVAPKLRAISPH